MKYIVIELQKTADNILHIVTTHDTINEAYNKFYTILAYAAISQAEKHSATMLTENGDMVDSNCFIHETEGEA